jgi:hypothetical protein
MVRNLRLVAVWEVVIVVRRCRGRAGRNTSRGGWLSGSGNGGRRRNGASRCRWDLNLAGDAQNLSIIHLAPAS